MATVGPSPSKVVEDLDTKLPRKDLQRHKEENVHKHLVLMSALLPAVLIVPIEIQLQDLKH